MVSWCCGSKERTPRMESFSILDMVLDDGVRPAGKPDDQSLPCAWVGWMLWFVGYVLPMP